MNHATPELPVITSHNQEEMHRKMVVYMRDRGLGNQRTSFSFSRDKSRARCHQTGQEFRILPLNEE